MKKFIMIFFFSLALSSSWAQGQWDVYYLPIDLLDERWIGKEIRVDFRSSSDTINLPDRKAMFFYSISRKDLVSIEINHRKIIFKEDWVNYGDHCVLYDQTLKDTNGKYLIRETFIKDITANNVKVLMHLYSLDKEFIGKISQDFNKCQILGFFYRIKESQLKNNNLAPN